MTRSFVLALALLVALLAPQAQTRTSAPRPTSITERVAVVDGVRINYRISGGGPVIVLLHGFAQTSHMWVPLMSTLSSGHTVIAPDLRGAGGSDRTPSGYDKKTLAKDVRGLLMQIGRGQERITIVGHDIGLMVAYAYAAQYPANVQKIVLMDAFLPGVGDWRNVWLARDLWHFHFYGRTPEALVAGRERIYLDHFWNDFAADETKSIPESDRQLYSAAYARANGIKATFQYFSSFEQDAADFERFAATRLRMPMLVLTGEKASGTFLIDQAKLVATNVNGVVVKNAGHWLMEEATAQVIAEIVAFVQQSTTPPPDASGARLTPAEIDSRTTSGPGTGSSGVAGIETIVLKGDPNNAGLYTILLKVPPHTRIEAHDHPDDRIATVISGTWYFGYGERFDAQKLKALPPGSFYTEPPGQWHFARTSEIPVTIQITGIGPSATRYSSKGPQP